jgi:hypothetical protein
MPPYSSVRNLTSPVYPFGTSILLCLLLALSASPAYGQATLVLQGRPTVRITEGGFGIKEGLTHLSPAEAKEYECLIHKRDSRFYWTSRDNKELMPAGSGAFITFMARDGSGYG